MPAIDDRRSPPPLIAARDVDFFHGRRRILHSITLDLRPGRHYIVAGPNGAGKSTLVDILARLRRPAAGSVTVMGRRQEEYDSREFARMLALAPQEYRFDFSFTIREVVSMGRRPYLGRWGVLDDADLRVVDAAIRDAHLDALADRAVTTLSGGERRRCVVARALAQTTPIILLDEPCAGLDIAQALSLMALARKRAEDGALVVTVSHDLNLAATFGHEIIFMKDGRVAAAGPVGEVFTGDIVSRVYDTEARISDDAFSGGYSVSFRTGAPPPRDGGGISGKPESSSP